MGSLLSYSLSRVTDLPEAENELPVPAYFFIWQGKTFARMKLESLFLVIDGRVPAFTYFFSR